MCCWPWSFVLSSRSWSLKRICSSNLYSFALGEIREPIILICEGNTTDIWARLALLATSSFILFSEKIQSFKKAEVFRQVNPHSKVPWAPLGVEPGRNSSNRGAQDCISYKFKPMNEHDLDGLADICVRYQIWNGTFHSYSAGNLARSFYGWTLYS